MSYPISYPTVANLISWNVYRKRWRIELIRMFGPTLPVVFWAEYCAQLSPSLTDVTLHLTAGLDRTSKCGLDLQLNVLTNPHL